MTVFLILASLFYVSGSQAQKKYDFCKKEKFIGEYCEGMKFLNKHKAK